MARVVVNVPAEAKRGEVIEIRTRHDDNWGKKLAGTPIPQAHPTGDPLYRLEWQGVGSLTRRLRNCLTGMRAELYPHGAAELVDLELYLMWRARGMKMEAPAVRP
jgi:sulfur-oxidizing protein SoxA